MINDKLPATPSEMIALIESIAPDLRAWLSEECDDTVHITTPSGRVLGRVLSIRLNASDPLSPGHWWWAQGMRLETELHLVERLCWLVEAPGVAGPNDVTKMRHAAPCSERGRALVDQCNAALLQMDSAAILACSRALPNNDWRKHRP